VFILQYHVYPAISKCPKQLPNCLKIAEAMVVLIVFLGVNYDINPYTVTNRYVKGIFISLMGYLFIVFVILVVILHIFDYQVNSK
jgi:hypothetical protein